MGVVIPFPNERRRQPLAWSPGDLAALDRLVAKLRPSGAVAWELEADNTRAVVIGTEDETLLIVTRTPQGLAVGSGWRHELLWTGAALERFA